MTWWDNPYNNGKRDFSEDIADGFLQCREEGGYVDKEGNVYDIAAQFQFNLNENSTRAEA